MAQDIVVRYKAEVDDLLRKLDQISDAQKEVIDGEIKANDQAKKAATTQQFAATKRNQLLELEKKKLAELQKAQKLAFDPKQIDAYNKKIAESNRNIELLTKTTEKELGGVRGAIGSFAAGAGAAIAAAFSVDAIIQFGRASIDAFLEAEKNAERLKFAITSIGGESEAVFDRLIRQSSQIEQISIFSDDSIQQAQAALAAFGLTGRQIEELIPKLADFATVSGTDIVEAANKIGAGLEGAGREFKKYGIEVSATATRLENYNSILEGSVKFAGAAEEATKTLTGQLEQQRNKADNLQEVIGSKLAPVFIGLKTAFFEATIALLGFNKELEKTKKADQAYKKLEDNAKKAAEAIEASGGSVIDQFTQSIEFSQERVNKLEASNAELSTKIRQRVEEISRSTKDILPQNDALIAQYNKQVELNNQLIEQDKQRIQALSKEVESRKETERTLSAEELRIKTLEELNGLLIENKSLNDNISTSNVQLIEKEIAVRKKLAEEIAKADVRKPDPKDIITKIESIKPKTSLKIPVELETPPANQVTKTGEEIGGNLLDSIFKRYKDEIELTQQFLSELTTLYSTFTERRIQEINREKEEQIKAIDEALIKNQEDLELRRVSEAEAVRNEKALIAEKLKAEETAAKKERELKRKAAIADKAAALITIAIQTAINVAKYVPPNPLIALAIALGAAQAAIVASQPIPYAKGTKNAKEGLARVGEQGEEIMYVPQGTKVLPNRQTNRYGEVLDAMFDNRFDEYVNRRYIAPALMKEKARRESSQQRSFAENIVQSAMVNPQTGLTYYDMEQLRKKGQRFEDETIEKFTDSLARKLSSSQSIYRR